MLGASGEPNRAANPMLGALQPQDSSSRKSSSKKALYDKSSDLEDLKKDKKKKVDPDRQAVDADQGEENDSFHRLYNKEIKVN